MGSSTWNPRAYASYSASVADKTEKDIFKNNSGCHEDLNPTKFIFRESCDSDVNPNSTPVIIAVDETGSMGHLATEIIKKGLGIIVQGIIDRKPISNPHILLAAVGDSTCDRAPLQATQFEADNKIIEQIEKFFIEHGGGGNSGESYPLVWYFAHYKTKCDSIIKRNRKGYLFTIGDEAPIRTIYKNELKEFLDINSEVDININDLLKDCLTEWEVFHLITPTFATENQNAIEKWRELLGERAIIVDDWEKLSQVIVSLMQVNEGQNYADVISSWDDKDTNIVVANSLKFYSDNKLANKNKSGTDMEIMEI
jgi:hypothetical protein